MSSISRSHEYYMRIALAYARRHIGMTGENPSVGCVIVKNQRIIAAAATACGGMPHAEVAAIAQAKKNCRNAAAYVTLEPCAHHGKTPPCVEALITAGIQQVFIAMEDPFAKVSGKGISRLKEAGIEVSVGLCKKEAFELNRGFFKRISQALPWVTLKLASSSDGGVALANGESQWITGDLSRKTGHMMRVQNHAIISGVNTIIADDPLFTCRLNGLELYSPIRIILDSQFRTPISSKVVQTASQFRTIIVTSSGDIPKRKEFEEEGAEILHVSANQSGQINLTSMLKMLAQMGISHAMVEAGKNLSTSFLKEKLVDEIYHFSAPKFLGSDAMPSIGEMALTSLKDVTSWRLVRSTRLQNDQLSIFRL